jgi:tetratricopeptide (TPR) repeat protein
VPGVSGPGPEPAGWFDAEHPALLSALDLAARDGYHRHAWQLSWVVRDYLNRQGLWHHLQSSQRTGHAAAAHGEPADRARTLWGLALAETTMGRYPEAHTHLTRALAIFERSGDPKAVEETHRRIGHVLVEQGDFEGSLEQCQHLLALHPPGGREPSRRACALNEMGWAKARLGRFAEAIDDAREALGLALHTPPFQLGDTWDTLGYAQSGLGRVDEAADSYRCAIGIYRSHGAPVQAARSLRSLGEAFEQAGRIREADTTYQQALALVARTDGPQAVRLGQEMNRVLARIRDL